VCFFSLHFSLRFFTFCRLYVKAKSNIKNEKSRPFYPIPKGSCAGIFLSPRVIGTDFLTLEGRGKRKCVPASPSPHHPRNPHLAPHFLSASNHRLHLFHRNPHILTELLKSHQLMLLFIKMLLYFLNQVTAVAFTFSGDDLDVFRINAQSCQLGSHSTASKFTIKMQQIPETFSVPFRYYRKIYGLFNFLSQRLAIADSFKNIKISEENFQKGI